MNFHLFLMDYEVLWHTPRTLKTGMDKGPLPKANTVVSSKEDPKINFVFYRS